MDERETPSVKNEAQLRDHYEKDSGIIHWKQIERFFAAGLVLEIEPPLDLIDVAVTMGLDQSSTVQEWLDRSLLHKVTDDTAKEWSDRDTELNAVVVHPWVLIQRIREAAE